MTAADVVNIGKSIIQVLMGSLSEAAQGIGSGANAFVTALIYDTTGQTPVASAFILSVALVGGISLAVAFGRRMFNFVITLGGTR